MRAFFVITIVLLINILACTLAFADYPPNNYSVPPEAVTSSSIRYKATFDAVNARVQKTMAADARAIANCELRIEGDWRDGTVNAYASRQGSVCHVQMFGGFARVSTMDKYALADVACHEVCHHIGGYPTYDGEMACEGQSDYCAQGCMEKVYPGRARAAGLVVGNVLAMLLDEPPVSYATPDTAKVRRTYCGHPHAQCRTDTYLAGIEARPRPRCWFAR